MEICPKYFLFPPGIYLSNENPEARTKSETSEVYLETCQTSKMKLFVKVLNGFQLQEIVFIF